MKFPQVAIFAYSLLLTSCAEKKAVSTTGSMEPLSSLTQEFALSPGVQVAFLQTGGISGIFNMLQITHNWHLIRISPERNFIRPMNPLEQKAVREVLIDFKTLSISQKDDVDDRIGSSLVARGWGEGEATDGQIKALQDALRPLLQPE